jgi:hypothetical protein
MTNNQDITETLPSRRYTCKTCGDKYRRGNAKSERLRPPICPPCERYESYRNYVQPSYVNYLTKLEELSQALVDRWDTPSWKDVKSTAEYINALRNHLKDKK